MALPGLSGRQVLERRPGLGTGLMRGHPDILTSINGKPLEPLCGQRPELRAWGSPYWNATVCGPHCCVLQHRLDLVPVPPRSGDAARAPTAAPVGLDVIMTGCLQAWCETSKPKRARAGMFSDALCSVPAYALACPWPITLSMFLNPCQSCDCTGPRM